jgi:anti-sigma-K factor RskA
MTDPSRWSLDDDPPRDEALARLLRAAEEAAPAAHLDWERLHARIVRSAAVPTGGSAGAGEWWDVVVQWRRVAAAASVAAILAAAVLLWRADTGGSELSLSDAAPESAALARVVAAYPDEAVLSSMLQDGSNDEFTSWEPR